MTSNVFGDLERAPAGTRVEAQRVIEALRWNDAGLAPAIAQDHASGEVLMLAWMNAESLAETLATGQVCYWSRSRARLWRKGEASGHVQRLRELRVDCDGDTLLLQVEQLGPACHSGRRSCFYTRIAPDGAEVTAAVDVDPASVYGTDGH